MTLVETLLIRFCKGDKVLGTHRGNRPRDNYDLLKQIAMPTYGGTPIAHLPTETMEAHRTKSLTSKRRNRGALTGIEPVTSQFCIDCSTVELLSTLRQFESGIGTPGVVKPHRSTSGADRCRSF